MSKLIPALKNKEMLPILLGLACAFILFTAASVSKKWLSASALGIIFAFSFTALTLRDFKFYLLMLAVFCLPIRLDFHLIFKTPQFVQLRGLPVSIFDLIFGILFIYWIFELMRGKMEFRLFPKISIPAIFYIALAAISAAKSQDMVLSFSMLILIIKSYVVFLYFANNIYAEKEIIWIVGILSLGVFIQSVIGILQHVSGRTLGMDIFGEGERSLRTARIGFRYLSRVGGTIGDPNSLAAYLNLILPILLCVMFTRMNLTFKITISIIFLLGCLTEIFTLSRGGWLALSFSTLVAFYGIFKEKFGSRLKAIALMLFVTILLFSTAVLLFKDVRTRMAGDDYGSAYSRLPMMQVALNMIASNPVSGVGLNNYTTAMNKYDRTRMGISYRFPFPVHNAYLIIAAESGLFALGAFLFTLLGGFRYSLIFFKSKDMLYSLLGIGWICGVITWMIHSMVRWDYAGTNTALWVSLAMVAALSCKAASLENLNKN